MLITDPADPRLDDIRNLNKSDKSGEGLVIAEGPLVVSRLAESRFPMRCLVGFPKKVEAYFSEYGEPECPIYEVSRETLAEVAGFDMHRGLVAAADRAPEPEVSEIVESAKTIAVLEGVGSDLRELASAISQLVSDTGGNVTREAVQNYYVGVAEVANWDIADAAVAGRVEAAVSTCRRAAAFRRRASFCGVTASATP